jgi:hypothetical protein
VTSLEHELNRVVPMADIEQTAIAAFSEVFDAQPEEAAALPEL